MKETILAHIYRITTFWLSPIIFHPKDPFYRPQDG